MVNGETPLAVFCSLELIYVPRKGKKRYVRKNKRNLSVFTVANGLF